MTLLGGTAKICIPSASKEFVLDLPIVRVVPCSWLDRLADALSMPWSGGTSMSLHPELTERNQVDAMAVDPRGRKGGNEYELLETKGKMYLRIAVLQRGFAQS